MRERDEERPDCPKCGRSHPQLHEPINGDRRFFRCMNHHPPYDWRPRPPKHESIREVRRRLTAAARLEPNYEEAIAAARQLGFGCHGYKPRRLICRLIGFHVRVFAMRTMSGDGSWSISAECCPIGGLHYPKKRSSAPPAPVAKPKVWNPPWEYGDSAFWLDPDLWNRTPMIGSRPDICWMHLDGPNFTGERSAPPPLMRGSLSDMERKATRSWGVRVV